MVITASFFVAYAENTRHDQRVKSVRAFLAALDLLQASGNIDAQHVLEQREICRAYLMGLKLGNPNDNTNGFRAARYPAFRKGYFLGNAPNVQLVSKQLKIGYGELLYLRHKLGQALTGKLLKAHGLHGPTPLEPSFRCIGVPRGPTIAAQPCKQCRDSAQATLYHCRVGQKQPHHILHNDNLYVCLPCHRNVERFELDTLKDMETKGTLIEEERNRLVVLRARVAKKRQQVNEVRKIAVAANGIAAVQVQERVKNRDHQSFQTKDFQQHPEKRDGQATRKKNENNARIANGGKRKANGENRIIKTEALYPPFFMDMLKDATVHFIQLYGQDSVYWNDIVALFTELLDREREHPEMVKLVRYTPKGSTKYRRFAFHAAVAPFIVKIGKKRNGIY